MCENNHKSLIVQHFRELLGHLALFYLVIWRYFTWSFGVILLGIFVVNYFVFCTGLKKWTRKKFFS